MLSKMRGIAPPNQGPLGAIREAEGPPAVCLKSSAVYQYASRESTIRLTLTCRWHTDPPSAISGLVHPRGPERSIGTGSR